MKKILKITAMIMAATMVLALTGCTSSSSSSSNGTKTVDYKTDGTVEDQFALPQEGEEIAVFNVEGYGTFKARLFPEVAPKAVENFTTLAKQGAYNGVPFHRIVEDFMIQTGDTTQNGGDGKSIFDGNFPIELNKSVHHYTGALAMARTNDLQNGQSTQFYVVSNDSVKSYTDAMWQQYETQTGKEYSDEVKAAYNEHGGAPSLDMQYTVFGQVFEGLDVVNQIAAVEVTENEQTGEVSQPTTPVILTSVEIVPYQA